MLGSKGQQFRDADAESQSENLQRAKRHVPLFAFNGANIGPMQAAKVSQFFLREPVRLPERSHVFGKDGSG